MGNGATKVSRCFVSSGDISCRHDITVHLSDPVHEGLGHSFCYIRPEADRLSNNKIHSEETTIFRSISGASVSANTSTSLSTALSDATTACPFSSGLDQASSTFESSDSFASLPLQPVPRGQFYSGSIALSGGSGPIERGFLSGPIERGFQSGPIDRGLYSGPFEKEREKEREKLQLQRTFSLRDFSTNKNGDKPKKPGLIKTLKRVLSNTIVRGKKWLTVPVKGVEEEVLEGDEGENMGGSSSSVINMNDVDGENDSEVSLGSQNLQWAQGKAGEDRVHMVISEEHGWVFVGIYDGFNGPDAPDYLLSNLYSNVHKGLKGLLWDDKFESTAKTEQTEKDFEMDDKEKYESRNNDAEHSLKRKKGKNLRHRSREGRKRCFDWKLTEQLNCQRSNYDEMNHLDVLKALSQALKKTEEAYFEVADKMAVENPELALMGSCVLVMLMKGEDVYLMNVGDSRAVLAQKLETDLGVRKSSQDLEIICEESFRKAEFIDVDEFYRLESLNTVQLTVDHSTYVDKEVQRIKREHLDDAYAITNDRVKGYLKVTRAFGVGFLKQPKWNDLLLEMFRIDYVGASPYITCLPFLHHHRLSRRDRFLILSSDGLYQYFTNEEAVAEVASFIAAFPEGDPAQHLVEELLFRAARRAGLDFHELLDIPQGDRRRYHDDVSVIVISLEGRIWRSSL